MIKAVFFDFDGVLTTDATGTTSIINYFRNATSVNIDRFEKAYRKYNKDLLYGKVTHTEVWSDICEQADVDFDIQALYDSFLETPIDKDMMEIAFSLKRKGLLIGIITDNKKDRIDKIISSDYFGFSFDNIVISSEIGSGKKEESIFNAAIKGLCLNFDECIFIDNNEENLIIPKMLGMKTLFYNHKTRDIVKLRKKIESIINGMV